MLCLFFFIFVIKNRLNFGSVTAPRISRIKCIIKRCHWDLLKPRKLKTFQRNGAKNTEPDLNLAMLWQEARGKQNLLGDCGEGNLPAAAHSSGVLGQVMGGDQ